MWIGAHSWLSQWVEWLPLFSHASVSQADKTYELWRSGQNGELIRKQEDDTVTQVANLVNNKKNPPLLETCIFSNDTPYYPSWIDQISYNQAWEEEWRIWVLRIEHHEFYNVLVIEIAHKYPWKHYIHVWNKRNPITWKHDGERTMVPKISDWRKEKRKYRIQYVSWNIWEWNYGIYCYWWEKKDWAKVNLNLESIIPAIKIIESLALQKLWLQ